MVRLYLDTNIVAHLQDPESCRSQTWFDQLATIREYLDTHSEDSPVFYSPAHLSDVRQGYVKDKVRALERLRFLSILTKNRCIAKYLSDNEVRHETRDVTEFFLENLENDEELYQPGTNRVDLIAIIEGGGFLDQYRKAPFDYSGKGPGLAAMGINLKRTKVNPTMYSFFLDFAEYMQGFLNEGHIVYKMLRAKLKEDLGVADKITGGKDPLALLDKLLPNSVLGATIRDVMRESFKEDPNDREGMITSDYMNLDLLGYRSDKITERHGYMNVTTDASHCFYASYCDIFVTNDIKAIAKAKAVITHYAFDLRVFNVEEFGDWIKSSNGLSEQQGLL